MVEGVTEKTAVGKAQKTGGLIIIAILIAMGMFLDGFDSNLFFFGGTFILKIIHVSPLLLGITATGFSAGIMIFSLIGGVIFDKITTRNGILIALAIISIFSALTGFVTNEYELVIYRFLVGFGVGMIQPEISAFLGDLRPNIRATVIATAGVMFMLGLAVSPLIFAGFSTVSTFDIPFIISGSAGLIMIIVTIIWVPSTYKIRKKPKTSILKNMNKTLILAGVSYLFFGIAYFAYNSYITPYLVSTGITETGASLIVSTFGFAGIALAYPGAILGDRTNRKMVTLLGTVIILIGTILLFALHVSLFVAFTGVIFLGGGYAIYGNIQALSQESVEDAWIGTAVGFIFFLFNIGAMIGGSFMGFLIPKLGYMHAGLIALVVPMIICVILLSVTPNVRSRTVTESTQSFLVEEE